MSKLLVAPVTIDQVRASFEAHLRAAGTSLEAPALAATWRAFAAFADVSVRCDDESLFFECGPSASDAGRFYVHFTRTFFGRDTGNHFWAHEVNCDFVFAVSSALAEQSRTIEIEELAVQPDERADFLAQVEDLRAVWGELENQTPLTATIYIGES